MMLKRQTSESKPSGFLRSLRAAGVVLGAAALTTSVVAGCLNRPVAQADPHTSNVFVAEIRQTAVDKIDLLMMIDNSISMADKQQILGDAVGSLVQRLVAPLCVDGAGNPTGASAGNDGRCMAAGTSPEFSPIKDIHVGIVSSSLGSHGGSGACTDATGDDLGQFVANVRRDPMYLFNAWPNNDDKTGGFLAWDPDTTRPRNNPPGITQQTQFRDDFKNMVLNVGQSGCGFESTLEGWYRFLVDPEPLIMRTPVVTDSMAQTTPTYSDNINNNIVLQQRARFLRPDSLLAVIMLSDENDCSIIEAGQGWLVGTSQLGGSSFRMPRATSVCEANPNDKCCTSCAAKAPDGCQDHAADAQCAQGSWTAAEDNLNLRCYNQKRRFGFDLLYPTQRYVDGLYETTVRKKDGTVVPNPIYASSPPRDRSLVFLAGIVGVPWQDIAMDPNADTLKYMSYTDMVDKKRWDLILGNPGDPNTGAAPTMPLDGLMWETPKDRSTLFGTGPHAVVGASGALAPSNTTGRPNVINGHEANIADNSDLQYACIFKLPTARAACTGPGCDCTDAMGMPNSYNRPLCDGTTQTYAKAFPGLRELQVLKDYGEKGSHNSIVASICPKSLTGATSDAGYGYNPAVSAIVDRLKEALRGKCLPRKLIPDDTDGRVPCAVVESSVPPAGQACSCTGAGKNGRKDVTDTDLKVAVYRQLHDSGYCGADGLPSCETFCLCEIEQFTGGNLDRCQGETTTPTDIYGYCYVDPSTAMDAASMNAQSQIVASCPDTQKRLLRFTGENVPAKGSIAMIACLGATITGK